MLAKCSDLCASTVKITWLIVWVPKVTTHPVINTTKCLRLGAVKQSSKRMEFGGEFVGHNTVFHSRRFRGLPGLPLLRSRPVSLSTVVTKAPSALPVEACS